MACCRLPCATAKEGEIAADQVSLAAEGGRASGNNGTILAAAAAAAAGMAAEQQVLLTRWRSLSLLLPLRPRPDAARRR